MGICKGCGGQLDSGVLSCPGCGGTAVVRASAAQQPIYQAGELLLDRYRVQDLLGFGSGGAVYGVLDERLDRRLAVKVLWEPSSPDDPEFQRSVREVLASQRAEHPNLVRIHDLVLVEGHPALVMEWVEGETLRQRVSREGPLPWDEAVRLTAGVLRGLSALHDLGIVHRDVKSGNVLLAGGSEAKLGDLGLAKGKEIGPTLTADSTVLGTPGYIAPEVLQGAQATPASDLYGVGVVLFETLAGVLPYAASSAHEMLARALRDPPALHLLRAKKVPRWLVRLVGRLLEKDPADRYRSAGAVLAALDRHAAGFGVARRWRRRGIAAALLAAALTGGLWAWRPWRETAATNLHVAGDAVQGISREGEVLWSVRLTPPIRAAQEWETAPDRANRFIAMHGGFKEDGPSWAGPPKVAVISAGGKLLADMDLLSRYNPYRGDFREEYFSGEIRALGDFDGDGYQDAIVACRHMYYPYVLYFLSGKERAVIGGYAHSGHLSSIERPGWPREGTRRLAFAVAINNRMGHQAALFCLSFGKGWTASPDIFEGSLEAMPSYRPLGLMTYDAVRMTFQSSPEAFVLRTGNETLPFDAYLLRPGEKGYLSPFQAGAPMVQQATFYHRVRSARDAARSGDPVKAVAMYREGLAEASDDAYRLYPLADGTRELSRAGRADLALSLLPDDLSKTANPGSLMLQKADLLTLLGRYAQAERLYLDLRTLTNMHVWYALPGYVRVRILRGAAPDRIYSECQRYFPELADHPAVRAWCLIPGLLDGHPARAESLLPPRGAAEKPYAYQTKALFLGEAEFWQALFDLDMGRPPSMWPDESAPETLHEPALKLKIAFLRAWKMVKEGKKAEGLPMLEKASRNLDDAAKREPEAILPSILCRQRYDATARAMREK